MVINYEKKLIFIGLPFSASSAISKELLEEYNFEVLFHKHANIPLLLKERNDIAINDFQIFAVIRNPVDIAFSVYNKLLTNPYNTFTSPKFFIENGGFVSRKAREEYIQVQDKKLSFEGYLQVKYKLIPYNNNLSVNRDYVTGIIRFDNLVIDFKRMLESNNITVKRSLPIYNRTKKIELNKQVSQPIISKVFSPFFNYNKMFFPDYEVRKSSVFEMLKFKISNHVRDKKILNYDIRQMDNAFSINDLKNER